jgi:hypothetical protein
LIKPKEKKTKNGERMKKRFYKSSFSVCSSSEIELLAWSAIRDHEFLRKGRFSVKQSNIKKGSHHHPRQISGSGWTETISNKNRSSYFSQQRLLSWVEQNQTLNGDFNGFYHFYYFHAKVKP